MRQRPLVFKRHRTGR